MLLFPLRTPVRLCRLTAILACLLGFCLLPAVATPLRVHPQNPYLLEFRGQPAILRTFAEHYGSLIHQDFNYVPYLNTLRDDGVNLTRVIALGFHAGTNGTVDPLSPPAARYLQPWPRASSGGNALDGQKKWDFTRWNEGYFTRLRSFVQAASDRGIVVEITLFSTIYTAEQWGRSPFNPVNNVQGYGPSSQYDTVRPVDTNLLTKQVQAVRRIVNELNGFDNVYYEIQNEPFWNQPGFKDFAEVSFHQTMLDAIRAEEAPLPNRHLVAHNFPQMQTYMSSDYDVINTHYPYAVPSTTIIGGENLLANFYSQGRPLGLDETGSSSALEARTEAWMFILGGGSIYNGLDASHLVYTSADEAGLSEPGPSIRGTLRNLGTYAGNLHLPAMRRNLSWIAGGAAAGSRKQAMAIPGQQYVAYFHHGQVATAPYSVVYYPISQSNHTVSLQVTLDAGSWRAVWTRPSDLAVLKTQDFTHSGGTRTLQSVTYQSDVALRIDRTGPADATPPPVPGNLLAATDSGGSISLSWNPSQADDLASYHIYRATSPGVPLVAGNRIATLGSGTTSHTDNPGGAGTQHYYVITAVDQNGNESTASNESAAIADTASLPFGGSPWPVPGLIECEDFDTGGENVAYHDLSPANTGGQYRVAESVDIAATNDGGGGFHITATESGEWLQYTLQVAQAGDYEIDLRCAIPTPGASVAVSMNGNPQGASFPLPTTANANTWQTVTIGDVTLSAGVHILRLWISGSAASAGSFNFLEISEKPWTGPIANAGSDIQLVDLDLDVFEPVTLDASGTVAGLTPITSYSWIQNGSPIATGINPLLSLPSGTHVIQLEVTDSAGLVATDQVTVTITSPGFVNGSFEIQHAGWNTSGNVFWTDYYGARDGSILTIFNAGNTTPGGIIEQSFPTVPGQIYQLSFDVGVIAFTSLQQIMRLEVVGGSALLTRTYTLNGTGSPGNGVQNWQSKIESFTADSNLTTVRFKDISTSHYNLDLVLDAVQVSTAATGRVLSVTSTPTTGFPVTLSPSDLSGQSGGNTGLSRTFEDGTLVNLSVPTSSPGAAFLKWQKNGIDFSSNPAISVTMDANQSLLAVYTPVNQAPTASNDSFSTGIDTPLLISAAGVLENDTDPEDDVLTAVLDSPPSHGTLILDADGGFTYTPDNGFEGTDSFTYHAHDGDLASGTVTVSLTVAMIVPGALINGSFESGTAGWTVSGNQIIIDSEAAYTSTDERKVMVFNSAQSTPNCVISQSFPTTPGQSYVLEFDMGIVGASTSQQRLQVTLAGATTLLSQIETLTGAGFTSALWAPKSYTFTADSASTTLTLTDVSLVTTNVDLLLDHVRVNTAGSRTLTIGSASGPGLAISVVPADNAGNTGGVTLQHRYFPNGSTVEVTAPSIHEGGSFLKWQLDGIDHATSTTTSVTLAADHTLTAFYAEAPNLLANGSFEDGYTAWLYSGNQFVFSFITPTDGLQYVEFNGGGFTPDAVLSQSFATIPGLTYQLKFDYGILSFNTSSTQSLLVKVDGITNLLTQTVSSTGPGGGNILWLPQSFSFVADSDISTLTFEDSSATTSGLDSLLDHVRVSGASTQRLLTVETAPSATLPVIISPADLHEDEDGDTLLTRNYPNNAVVTLSAPPVFEDRIFLKWRKNGEDFSSDTDTTVNMDGDHTLLAVYRSNEAPQAVADSHSITSGDALEIAAPGVLTNDSDADTDPLTASLESGPAHGVLQLAPDGGFIYTPDPGYVGPDSFSYLANDGITNSNVASVAITVEPCPEIILPAATITQLAGDWIIEISAPQTGVYELQRSSDLATWIPVEEIEATGPGPVEFTTPVDTDPRMFYRIALKP